MGTLKERLIATFKKMDKSISDHIIYLMDRWEDEKEYEDWEDYNKSMKEVVKLEKDVKFIKGTKKPFGFIYEQEGIKMQFFIKQKPNNKVVATIKPVKV